MEKTLGHDEGSGIKKLSSASSLLRTTEARVFSIQIWQVYKYMSVYKYDKEFFKHHKR